MNGAGMGSAWLTRGLLILCLALAYPIYLGFTHEPDYAVEMAANTAAVAAEDNSLEPAWDPPALDDLIETVERPLFNQDRRPTPTAASAPVETTQTEAPVDLAVKGVVIAERSRTALLQIRQNQRMVRVAEGDQVGGWRIDAITPVGVRISRDGEVSDLLLKDRPGQRPRPRRATPPRQDTTSDSEAATEPAEGEQDEPD